MTPDRHSGDDKNLGQKNVSDKTNFQKTFDHLQAIAHGLYLLLGY